MTGPSRQVIIAGNWKMYKTIEESVAFIQELTPLVTGCAAKVYLAVPFTAISAAADAAKESNIVIGAQNMNDASEGAFTGEIAGKMLKDAGANFVIIGHSERRRIFHESNEFINRKIRRALAENLQVILCIGESREERDSHKTEEVLSLQIEEGLKDIKAEQLDHIVLAYEPVWAIGAVEPATTEVAEETQAFCRKFIGEKWDASAAEKLIIQYGGSVKPDNAKDFLNQSDVDGLLVGGASLSAQEFAKIVNCYNSSYV
jgi:triosephosphate isomerase (TIM)